MARTILNKKLLIGIFAVLLVSAFVIAEDIIQAKQKTIEYEKEDYDIVKELKIKTYEPIEYPDGYLVYYDFNSRTKSMWIVKGTKKTADIEQEVTGKINLKISDYITKEKQKAVLTKPTIKEEYVPILKKEVIPIK